MVLRRGTTARRNGTGGHRPYVGRPGIQVVKIPGRAAARTGPRDYKAKAAGHDPVTVGSAADDHEADDPSVRPKWFAVLSGSHAGCLWAGCEQVRG
jgi:hypothetical protein